MRAIVVSNCNTTAYYNYLKAMFPEWDTRSVLTTQADAWLQSAHEPFLDFLAKVDVFIGLPEVQKKISPKYLNGKAVEVVLPSFVFMGTRPDCFWLPGITSATGNGVIHSKIAAAAFWAGKSAEEARRLYTGEHYEALGYFDSYARSRADLLASYRAVGVELEAAFEKWRGYGDFMYTPNHPQSRLLFDVVDSALKSKGICTAKDAGFVEATRATFDDYLSQGIIWPVYPEIAERLSLSNAKRSWRTSAAREGAEEFDLPAMLERSYAAFAAHPEARRRISTALGGEQNLLTLSGRFLGA